MEDEKLAKKYGFEAKTYIFTIPYNGDTDWYHPGRGVIVYNPCEEYKFHRVIVQKDSGVGVGHTVTTGLEDAFKLGLFLRLSEFEQMLYKTVENERQRIS